jgi:ribosomal-protein-alanine N-acetyltransferase
MTLRLACALDAPTLAAIHASAFDSSWGADQIASLFSIGGVFGQIVECDGDPAGFILVRVVADEAEILTLAIATNRRRRGLGETLLASAAAEARERGAQTVFLEVASDSRPALCLYRKVGFAAVGLRKGYYDGRHNGARDALVLSLDLNRRLPPPYHQTR